PELLREGPDYVLHAILDFIVDGYFPIVEAIEEDVLKMEQRMLAAFLTREEVTRIFTLRRELVRFQRVLGPMLEVGRKLVNLQLP
ncbi:CorA family divalent cation transporter, partial [Klebsiella pneumoniae]